MHIRDRRFWHIRQKASSKALALRAPCLSQGRNPNTLQDCVNDARSLLTARALSATAAGQAAAVGDRRLTRREEQKLLAPLLRLRQACCHPQVVTSSLLHVQRTCRLAPSVSRVDGTLCRWCSH